MTQFLGTIIKVSSCEIRKYVGIIILSLRVIASSPRFRLKQWVNIVEDLHPREVPLQVNIFPGVAGTSCSGAVSLSICLYRYCLRMIVDVGNMLAV